MLGAGPVAAQDEGDPGEGATLAESECALCHRLPDGTGTPVGPDFEALAEEGIATATLKKILESAPHTGVVRATQGQVADLAAWLETLAPGG